MKRSPLLLIGSLIIMILGIINLIASIVQFIQYRQVFEMVASVGAGGFAAMVIILSIVILAVFVIAGLLGLRGKSKVACIVFGIICIILSVLMLTSGPNVVVILMLVASIVYLIGAFMSQPQAPVNTNPYQDTNYQQ